LQTICLPQSNDVRLFIPACRAGTCGLCHSSPSALIRRPSRTVAVHPPIQNNPASRAIGCMGRIWVIKRPNISSSPPSPIEEELYLATRISITTQFWRRLGQRNSPQYHYMSKKQLEQRHISSSIPIPLSPFFNIYCGSPQISSNGLSSRPRITRASLPTRSERRFRRPAVGPGNFELRNNQWTDRIRVRQLKIHFQNRALRLVLK
jgi:hypothetical protein